MLSDIKKTLDHAKAVLGTDQRLRELLKDFIAPDVEDQATWEQQMQAYLREDSSVISLEPDQATHGTYTPAPEKRTLKDWYDKEGAYCSAEEIYSTQLWLNNVLRQPRRPEYGASEIKTEREV